jgi:YbbR domain-containing protein
MDDTDVIPTVTIYAKRSVIDKLESKNVIATADVREIEDDGSVKISLSTDKYANSIEDISGSIGYVQLRVEPMKTKSFAIEVETVGEPEDGYMHYESSAEQNQVIISGPQSYVEKIGRAAVQVDITESDRNISSYPDIILYDMEGGEITTEEMEAQKLHLNISSVRVMVTIYQTKDVPIICGSEVPIADGYKLESGPEADPSSIQIAGAAGILRDISTIEIPSEDIATEPVSSNIHKSIRIDKYLPEGVVVSDTDSDMITVYMRVSQEASDSTDTSEGSADSADSGGDTASLDTDAAY